MTKVVSFGAARYGTQPTPSTEDPLSFDQPGREPQQPQGGGGGGAPQQPSPYAQSSGASFYQQQPAPPMVLTPDQMPTPTPDAPQVTPATPEANPTITTGTPIYPNPSTAPTTEQYPGYTNFFGRMIPKWWLYVGAATGFGALLLLALFAGKRRASGVSEYIR